MRTETRICVKWALILFAILIVEGISWYTLDGKLLFGAILVISFVVIFVTLRLRTVLQAISDFLSVVLLILISLIWLINTIIWEKSSTEPDIINCYYGEKINQRKSGGRIVNYEYIYNCFDQDTTFLNNSDVTVGTFYSNDDRYNRVLLSKGSYISRIGLQTIDKEKYRYHSLLQYGYNELGNDSYEYALFEPFIVYEHYGLNIVYSSTKQKNDSIIWTTIFEDQKGFFVPDNNQISFLVYSNINPDFYDGWHICPDSLCTPENIAKVDSAGYGYIFRGKIYSAAETEKYWNIIEQYKLRH